MPRGLWARIKFSLSHAVILPGWTRSGMHLRECAWNYKRLSTVSFTASALLWQPRLQVSFAPTEPQIPLPFFSYTYEASCGVEADTLIPTTATHTRRRHPPHKHTQLDTNSQGVPLENPLLRVCVCLCVCGDQASTLSSKALPILYLGRCFSLPSEFVKIQILAFHSLWNCVTFIIVLKVDLRVECGWLKHFKLMCCLHTHGFLCHTYDIFKLLMTKLRESVYQAPPSFLWRAALFLFPQNSDSAWKYLKVDQSPPRMVLFIHLFCILMLPVCFYLLALLFFCQARSQTPLE